MKLSKSSNIASSIVLTATLLSACGGGGDVTSTPETTTPPTPSGSPTPSPTGVPSPTPTPPGPPAPSPEPGATITLTPTSPPSVGVVAGRFESAAPPEYSATSCVRDRVTGLTWEGKSVNGGPWSTDTSEKGAVFTNLTSTSLLEYAAPIGGGDLSWRYPQQWEIDRIDVGLGAAGHPHGWWTHTYDATFFQGNVSAYINRKNGRSFCGYSNWRLPTQAELTTLLNDDFEPRIDPIWFPNTARGNYWTSDGRMGDWNSYRNVHFGSAMSFTSEGLMFDFWGFRADRSMHHHVRLVRN